MLSTKSVEDISKAIENYQLMSSNDLAAMVCSRALRSLCPRVGAHLGSRPSYY